MRSLWSGGDDTFLSLEHDRSWRVARRSDGSLVLHDSDTALYWVASLVGIDVRTASAVYDAVADGRLGGCSPRYSHAPLDERVWSRSIIAASLTEISLTATPAVKGSVARLVDLDQSTTGRLREIGRKQWNGRARQHDEQWVASTFGRYVLPLLA